MSFESALDSLEEIVAPADFADQLNFTGRESLEVKDELRYGVESGFKCRFPTQSRLRLRLLNQPVAVQEFDHVAGLDQDKLADY